MWRPRRRPLVIVLEDIHWADNATLLALRSLATTAGGAVLWVVTAAHRGGRAGGAGDVVGAAAQRMPHSCDWRR